VVAEVDAAQAKKSFGRGIAPQSSPAADGQRVRLSADGRLTVVDQTPASQPTTQFKLASRVEPAIPASPFPPKAPVSAEKTEIILPPASQNVNSWSLKSGNAASSEPTLSRGDPTTLSYRPAMTDSFAVNGGLGGRGRQDGDLLNKETFTTVSGAQTGQAVFESGTSVNQKLPVLGDLPLLEAHSGAEVRRPTSVPICNTESNSPAQPDASGVSTGGAAGLGVAVVAGGKFTVYNTDAASNTRPGLVSEPAATASGRFACRLMAGAEPAGKPGWHF